ncbi:hypothetical protein JDW21_19160 [Bacillus subtilis]|uniref:hypothetical protein n=1 Tax=Bacillota TaxID=1239 RepID=UPI000927D08D|nr:MULTISPECIES: hypothetical protein [Bacillota]MDE1407063.1 hypothetical protein [Bacillus licheniformis]NFT30631.1 hypothetical protein [Clostridium sporogenes]OJT57380.1 hypothetical protein BFP47_11775 [Bacillus licheniformis]OJT69978.1 hypothetical protein BFP46_05115 [Bacillus licheniformis]GIN25477.1 hypothetical protein J31TS2_20570 [Bacillus licheniformis]
MTSYTAEYIENRLEILFPKYKIEQVGMHLTEVALTNIEKILLSYKTFFGVKYAKKYAELKEDRIIHLNKVLTLRSVLGDIYEIKLGIDEESKTVYWKPV